MFKRILAFTGALALASSLILNVSAASYNRDFGRGDHTCYVSGSCTSTVAKGTTSTDSRTALVKTKVAAYGYSNDGGEDFMIRNTSAERTGSSTMQFICEGGELFTHCEVDHYEDGVHIYANEIDAN